MAVFTYKALNGAESVVQGTIEAENQIQAVARLNAQGLFPTALREGGLADGETAGHRKNRVSHHELTSFTRELADLLKSGLQLVDSLEIVCRYLRPSPIRRILMDLQDQMKKGSSLSNALSKYPEVFSSFYVSLVKSGEMGGMLDQSLDRIADSLEKDDELYSKVRAALMYPCLIGVVGLTTFIFLLTFVIPKLGAMFSDMGQTLPFITRFLLFTGGLMIHWWAVIMVVVGVAGAWLIKMWPTSQVRGVVDKWVLTAPIVGPMRMKILLFNISRSLGTLLKHGVPIIDAVKTLEESEENTLLKKEFTQLMQLIREGYSLGDGFRSTKFLPASFAEMVLVGEKSGHVDEKLMRLAEIYERQADRQLKIVTSLLEPLLIVVIGVVLGIMVIGMLLPIFEMNMFVK